MRICIVSSYHLEVTAPYIHRLQQMHDVDFYVPMNNGDRNIFLFDIDARKYGRTGFLNEVETKEALGSHAQYFSQLNKIWFFLYPNTGFARPALHKCFIDLALTIKKQRYDVIHVIGQFPLLLYIHMLNPGTARVHTLHESVPHTGVFQWHEKLMLKAIAKLNVQLIFPSEITRKRFLDYTHANPAKCHKIYFGIVENLQSFINPAITENANQVLLFGFINSYKGAEYLVEATKIAQKSFPEIQTVIAGKWSLPDLKESIKNDSAFRIIDKSLSNEEMTTLIQESTIVVCPYTSASNSGVVMTAFVFDKPLIASSIDGLSEVISDRQTGLLVPSRNSAALAEAMLNLLGNPDLRKQMKKNISKGKTDAVFSWNRITEQTIDVYKKCFQSRKTNPALNSDKKINLDSTLKTNA